MSTSSIESPGCVILLIDESAAMDSAVQEDPLELGQEPKSKGVSTANAINSLLKQLGAGPEFDVALVGYGSDEAGGSVADVRWSGPLAGREFVSTKELAANPVTVETRQRRLPDPASFTGFRTEPVEVPVWYQPKTGGTAPQVLAFQKCKELLERWSRSAGSNPGAPLVIHLFAAGSGDGNPTKAIDEVKSLDLGGRQPLVFQAHFSTAKAVPPTLYTSNRTFLAPGPSRDLFERCSMLTQDLIADLKTARIIVGTNARGMVFNAKLIDIVRFLSLVKAHVQNWPAKRTVPATVADPIPAPIAAPEPVAAAAPIVADIPTPTDAPLSPTDPVDCDADTVEFPVNEEARGDGGYALANSDAVREKAALVVFLLDRSVQDPFAADPNNPCFRLQEQVNDWLTKIAKKPTGQIEIAAISYGMDSVGEVEVRNTFEAGLSGRVLVPDTELESGAIHIQEVEQQLPNGIGGLITLMQKQFILIELEPTSAAPPQPGFEATAAAISDWCGRHPDACSPPVVLHLTRGQHSAGDLESAVAPLQSLSVSSGPVVIYHAIATETPHSSISYCETDADLDDPELQAAFAVSSPLLGREALTQSKPALVKPQSRGIVVNGKFDLLLDGIREALSCE